MKKSIICFIAILLFGFTVISDAFADAENKCTVIQGVISRISKLPSSVAADYPDALYAAVMDVEGYISGPPVPKQISIVMPAFTKRKKTPEALYYVGAKIEAQLINWDDAPQKIQQTQIFDDINNFTLQNYYVPSSKKISLFAPNIIQKFSSMEVLPEEEMPPTVRSKKSIDARNAVIARDLAAVRKLVQAHGGYEKWNEELAPILNYFRKKENQNQEKQINGVLYKIWGEDFMRFRFRKSSVGVPPCIEGAVALKSFLDTKGIDLIVVIPSFAIEPQLDLFYPGKAPADAIFDTFRVKTVENLLASGIETIDLHPQIIKQRHKYPFFLHKYKNLHQTVFFNELLAKELKSRLLRYDIQPLSKEDLSLQRIEHKSDAVVALNFRILRHKAEIEVAEFSDPTSPVVVTGDSFSYNPGKSSSFSAFLAAEAGILPHAVARINSSGARKLADLLKLPNSFWLGKKVVIVFVAPQSLGRWYTRDVVAEKLFAKGESLFSRSGETLRDGVIVRPIVKSAEIVTEYDDSGFFAKSQRGTDVVLSYDTGITVQKGNHFVIKLVVDAKRVSDVYVMAQGLHKIITTNGAENIFVNYKVNRTTQLKFSVRCGANRVKIKSIEIRKVK